MKRFFICVLLILISVANLCSFCIADTKKENYSLQKTVSLDAYEAISDSNKPEKKANKSKEEANADEQLRAIFSDFLKILPEGVPSDAGDISGAVGISEAFAFVTSVLEESRASTYFCMLLGIALLFCLAELFSDEAGEAAATVKSASALILSLPVLYFGKEVIVSVSEGISSGSDFFSEVIPIFSSVVAIGAGGATAGSAAVTMNASLSVVSEILAENLLPMSTLIFGLSLLSSVDTGQGVSGVAKGVRNCFNFFIGLVCAIIVAVFGAQTFVSASRDSLALRSAKYALSGMIPIVGGTVSGTLSLLISGVRLLSGTIGVISVIALLSLMGAPLVSLLFYRFCIGACITLTSFSGAVFGERFFSSVRGAVDCLIAVLTSSSLVYILEIIILAATLGNVS
ncbi:MAG: hypothetical protein IJD79_01215 [Clostridia bacterium]|nr:hypothetical protein [Clostridia bacterium]